jgi:hypothetical protein
MRSEYSQADKVFFGAIDSRSPNHLNEGGRMNKRDLYIEKLKAQLDVWNAEVAKWEAKTRGAQADMRIEYEKQLETFRGRRDKGLEQLRKVQAATGDAWIDLVRGADEAWAKMREAFEKAQSHFRK